MRLDDCYRLLDLDPGASDEELKRAYRDLTKIWHPDRFAHDPSVQRKAQEKLKAINEAYQTVRAARADGWAKAEHAAEWRVRVGEREMSVADLDSLAHMADRGRIGEEAEVFNPGVGRWMPLLEVPELRSAVRRGKLRRYRSYAFACAFAALVILLRRPTPSGLLIAALLFCVAFFLIARMRRVAG